MKQFTLVLTALVFGFCVASAMAEAPGATSAKTFTVLLIRHAEKLDTGADPGLSATGLARSETLASMLGDAALQAIWSSDYERTRETARPLASSLGMDVQIYDPRALEAMAAKLVAAEENALVIGHSNTTPELVQLLGGDPHGTIDDASEFDRLYVVTLLGGKALSTTLLRYPATRPGS